MDGFTNKSEPDSRDCFKNSLDDNLMNVSKPDTGDGVKGGNTKETFNNYNNNNFRVYTRFDT